MRKMTVKDFIDYSSPCFGCSKPNNFRIGVSGGKSDDNFIHAAVGPNFVEIDLRIKYANILKLYIFHKTNQILASDKQALIKYLDERQLFLDSLCPDCKTQTVSADLVLHLDAGYIEGTILNYEATNVRNAGKLYHLRTYYGVGISDLVVVPEPETKSGGNQLHLELPLLPRERFKNRDQFIDKVKTYILFS